MQVEIFPTDEIVDEVVYAVKALDIPDAPTKLSIEQPPSLEPKTLLEDLYYSSKLQFEQEEKLLQEHKKGI